MDFLPVEGFGRPQWRPRTFYPNLEFTARYCVVTKHSHNILWIRGGKTVVSLLLLPEITKVFAHRKREDEFSTEPSRNASTLHIWSLIFAPLGLVLQLADGRRAVIEMRAGVLPSPSRRAVVN
jgi:hypothetical protein